MRELQCAVLHSESDVVRALRRGDETAVEKLYREHADSVFRFVYRRLGESYEDAEEITQDTFLAALNLAHTYRGESSVITWLCGIAKLRIADFYRRQNRDKRIPPHLLVSLDQDSIGEPEARCGARDQMQASELVDGMMSDLREDERDALLLRYVEEFSVREVSQMMRRTEKGVESILTRAKRKARAALGFMAR